jgi:acetyl-CoA carboxylase carboxyltransferase component
VNAVYANRIAEIEDPDERQAFIDERRAEYEKDVDLLRLASDLVIDAIVEPEDLRTEIVARLRHAARTTRAFSDRRHGIPPV